MIRKLLFGCALAAGLSLGYTADAQTPQYTYAVTGGNNIYPFSDATNNKVQWIFTPSVHFPTAPVGLMDSVYFRANAAYASATYTNLTIKMGPTTLTQFPAGSPAWVGGLTTVYTAPTTTFTNVANQGWFGVALPAPYFFDPGQGLIVEVSQTAYTGGITIVQEATATSPNARIFGNILNATGTTSTGRANLGFHLLPAPPCSGMPTAGTTQATAPTVCSGAPVSFFLQGNSLGTGLTYQLLSAPAVGGPYTAVGAAQSSAAFTANPTVTAFYRVRVVCANGGGVDTSTPVQVSVPALYPGGTYTINNALPTGGMNFNNFTDAVSAIACGITGPVVFNVTNNATAYTDVVTIPHIPTTSAVNTITFNGNGATIAFNASNTNVRAAFNLTGADWVRIYNLNLTSTGAYGVGVQLTNDADHNIVSGCTINLDTTSTGTNYAGLVMSGSGSSATGSGSLCDSNEFLNNSINGGYYGITAVGTSGANTFGNVIRGNVVRNAYLYGLYNLYQTDLVIDSNDISRATRPTLGSFYGILVSTGCLNSNITRNRVHDVFNGQPTSTGILYGLYSAADGTAGQPNRWTNNAVYNIHGSTGTHNGIYNSSADYNLYRHNTILLEDTAHTGTAVAYGLYQLTAASGIDVRNNIFVVRRGGTGTKAALYFSTAATTFTSNYNDLYVPGTTGTNSVGYANSTSYATLANWQAGVAADTASVSVDPMFIGTYVGNVTPTNAVADNLGQPVGVLVDINGSLRSPTLPDIGAVEWSFIPPCAAATALSDAAAATSANVGWTGSISTNVGYELHYSTSPVPPTGASQPVSGTSASLSGLTPNTVYYYCVRTVCGPNSYSPYVCDSFKTCAPPASTLIAVGSPFPATISICQGDTATLRAPGGAGNTYLFLLNGVVTGTGAGPDSILHTQQPGTYRVVVTNATGCYDTSAAAGVTVMVNPPPMPVITQLSYNQITTSPFSTYQWNLAGTPIAGAIFQTHNALFSGNGAYTVTVTDANGCRATSSPYTLTTASVGGAAGAATHIRIFPNPTTGLVFIESGVEVRASVWSLDGRKLLDVEKATSVDLSGLAGGVYMLRLTDGDGAVLATERLTKTN